MESVMGPTECPTRVKQVSPACRLFRQKTVFLSGSKSEKAHTKHLSNMVGVQMTYGKGKTAWRAPYRKTASPWKRKQGVSKAVKAWVKREMKVEKTVKVDDVYMASVSVSTTAGVYSQFAQTRSSLNIGGGGEEDSRTTNAVKYGTLEWNIKAIGSDTNVIAQADAYNTVRMVIFKYKGPNFLAAYPAIGNWLTATMQGATTWTVDSMFKPRLSDFQILYDKSHTLRQLATGGTGANGAVAPGLAYFRGKITKGLGKVIYQGDNAGDDTGGMIGVVLWSDSTIAPNPFVDGTIRLTYTDV